MTVERYGVIALFYEFLLSALIFIGGGLLLWHDGSYKAEIFFFWGVVGTFWFTRRTQEATQSNQSQAIQQALQALQTPPVTPVEQPKPNITE